MNNSYFYNLNYKMIDQIFHILIYFHYFKIIKEIKYLKLFVMISNKIITLFSFFIYLTNNPIFA